MYAKNVHRRFAEESRHEFIGRMVEDLERCIKLLKLTVVQDSYPVRQGHRFELIMRDDDR